MVFVLKGECRVVVMMVRVYLCLGEWLGLVVVVVGGGVVVVVVVLVVVVVVMVFLFLVMFYISNRKMVGSISR